VRKKIVPRYEGGEGSAKGNKGSALNTRGEDRGDSATSKNRQNREKKTTESGLRRLYTAIIF
jgi:hypothetical protein